MNELIKLGHAYALSVDELIVLYSLKYPDTIVDSPCNIGYMQHLEMVVVKGDEKTLTAKGFEIVGKIEALFKTSKVKALPAQMIGDNNRMKEYIELWPKRELPSGKPARASEKVLLRCFTWFFTNYNYSWEIVLDATYNYVISQESKGFKHCRTNQYFIDKTTGGIRESVLADYCELVINGEENSAPSYTQKVV